MLANERLFPLTRPIDFPSVLKAGGYVRALELVRDELDFLNDQDKEWLFSRTVQQVWKFG